MKIQIELLCGIIIICLVAYNIILPTEDTIKLCCDLFDYSEKHNLVTQVGNPASQFCECVGGKVFIEYDDKGNQRGLCKVGLVTYDEWNYFGKNCGYSKNMINYENKI